MVNDVTLVASKVRTTSRKLHELYFESTYGKYATDLNNSLHYSLQGKSVKRGDATF